MSVDYRNIIEDDINHENENLFICSICLSNHDSIKIKNVRFECNHIFCEECIMKWFQKNNSTCPICRLEFFDIENAFDLKELSYVDVYRKISNLDIITFQNIFKLLKDTGLTIKEYKSLISYKDKSYMTIFLNELKYVFPEHKVLNIKISKVRKNSFYLSQLIDKGIKLIFYLYLMKFYFTDYKESFLLVNFVIWYIVLSLGILVPCELEMSFLIKDTPFQRDLPRTKYVVGNILLSLIMFFTFLTDKINYMFYFTVFVIFLLSSINKMFFLYTLSLSVFNNLRYTIDDIVTEETCHKLDQLRFKKLGFIFAAIYFFLFGKLKCQDPAFVIELLGSDENSRFSKIGKYIVESFIKAMKKTATNTKDVFTDYKDDDEISEITHNCINFIRTKLE